MSAPNARALFRLHSNARSQRNAGCLRSHGPTGFAIVW